MMGKDLRLAVVSTREDCVEEEPATKTIDGGCRLVRAERKALGG
jgi:hypothetical protein